MADVPAVVEPIPTGVFADLAVAVDPFVANQEYEILPTKTAFGTPVVYYQRIYDTGVGGYVYYTLDQVTPTPAPGDTTPNHTNNLVAVTHSIIEERLLV